MYRHCPSAKTVSKAREDFPEPETPVMTVTRSWGMAREMFFRLFCLAPSIRSQRGCAIRSVLLRWKVYLSMPPPGNPMRLTALGQFGQWHWGKLRARSTQPSPRAAPSARTATRERAGSPRRTWVYVEGCRPARNVAVRAERLGREARAEWIWRSKLTQCRPV